jgi:probable HAF family extracellular repeat protein
MWRARCGRLPPTSLTYLVRREKKASTATVRRELIAMRSFTRAFVAAVALVTVTAGGTAASAAPPGPRPGATADLRVLDLGTLHGFCCSYANAINDRGDVVGLSAVADGENPPLHAFLWRHGRMSDLGTLGGDSSSATAVNDRGDIAGYSQLPNGSTHAVLWRDGHPLDLGTLGGDSLATGINDRGVVVGRTVDAAGALVGFRWYAGVMTPLVTADGTGVAANAVNNREQVAGVLQSQVLPPVRFQDGVATVLVDAFGEGAAINARGDVTGSFVQGPQQAFLYRAGVFTPVASPAGAEVTVATGINNRDDLVGFAIGAGGTLPYWWPDAGAPLLLPALNAGQGSAADVNNSRQIVGWSSVTPGGTEAHAVLWTR